MIVYDLACENHHAFEGWFASSADFAEQKARGLLACPQCGSEEVSKAPMAPAVPRKGNQLPATPHAGNGAGAGTGTEVTQVTSGPLPAEVQQALARLAEAQAKALKNSRWVGKDFAEASRAIHYGERKVEAIHGEASLEEAKMLIEEGIEVAPLPFPVAPPDELN